MGTAAKWRYEASAQSIGPVAVCYMDLFGFWMGGGVGCVGCAFGKARDEGSDAVVLL
jgi:hypothetical protein